MTWTLLGEKHNRNSPPPSSSAVVGRYFFFYEGFLWQTLLYIWHLTASLVQGRRKYRYLLTYSVRRSRKIDCGDERRRSFSPSQVYKLLNLCSICFSVLCALLSDEIKIISLLVKNSVWERGDERLTDGDIMGTLFYLNLYPSNKTRWKRFGDEMEPELGTGSWFLSSLFKASSFCHFILNFIGACISLSNDEQKFNVRWCPKSGTPSQQLCLYFEIPSFQSLWSSYIVST